jgi:hypothetical protein
MFTIRLVKKKPSSVVALMMRYPVQASDTKNTKNIGSKQAKSVINSYHDHGESEHFHSEYKTDLDLKRHL